MIRLIAMTHQNNINLFSTFWELIKEIRRRGYKFLAEEKYTIRYI